MASIITLTGDIAALALFAFPMSALYFLFKIDRLAGHTLRDHTDEIGLTFTPVGFVSQPSEFVR